MGPAPDWGLPELGGILSGVEAPGLEQCEACSEEDRKMFVTRSPPRFLKKQTRRLQLRVRVTSSRPRGYEGGAATPTRIRRLCL